MGKKNQDIESKYFEIQMCYPSIDDLVSKAEKLTDSCVHPDQVTVSRNFVMNLARRGLERNKYNENDLFKLGVLVDHMAKRKTRTIYSLEKSPVLH